MLLCIFVFSEACLENRIVFALWGKFNRALDAWLVDCCGTYLVRWIQAFRVLLAIDESNESIYHFLYVALF